VEATESYYDKKSESYESVRRSLVFRVYDAITWKYLEPYIPMSTDSLVLDAGGGNGRWAIPMAKKGCRVVLVDISEGMLNIARQRVAAEGLHDRIEVRKGDIRKLDYPDETFDFVFSDHTLFLFDNPDEAVRELTRVLKPGALIILSAQNRLVQTLAHLPDDPTKNPEILQKAFKVLHRQEHSMLSQEPSVKIHTLTPDEFRNVLERNGLNVERMVCKLATMPLRLGSQFIMKTDVPEEIMSSVLDLELAFSEEPDAVGLGGHIQAIARKSARAGTLRSFEQLSILEIGSSLPSKLIGDFPPYTFPREASPKPILNIKDELKHCPTSNRRSWCTC
jgi:ubiquinone/menaquinone biosynthesis C-methylase UbiE